MKARTVLAIDLSTARGEIAVSRGGEVVYEASFTAERSHNAQLFAPLGQALDVAGAALNLIVVGTGPGSYTGVRIAIAAAQGVALSRGVPIVGWPSVCAPQHPLASFAVIGDARRGLFYTGRVESGVLAGDLQLHDAEAARAAVALPGSGPWLCFDPTVPLALTEVLPAHPSAAGLAERTRLLAEEEIMRRAALPLEPVYLQDPFITTSKRAGKRPGLRPSAVP